ncbi:MAG: AbrB/MazE/SpoVT family DNA-binding domain-containing protein [Anaerolineae bacterium]|jgi:bifunctional DNA-binding transcriptional regulator/antitoxin component of YhaV-PrlF toxin-antitoxin module|nr:AbrB/MazE/SpoVT family DNA-binding domain-containing protein [Anaerolineae bacterium]HQV29457.1 AbrB/MazE/SpoVT family DNA-binding domain-containing protein [Thermoflexales bacterium]
MITTITGKNQVTLPAEIVKALALTPGTRLEWRIGPDGSIVAQPRPSRARLAVAFLGSGRRLLKPGDDPVAELIAAREAEDAEADPARP